jgi:hypothetical protein
VYLNVTLGQRRSGHVLVGGKDSWYYSALGRNNKVLFINRQVSTADRCGGCDEESMRPHGRGACVGRRLVRKCVCFFDSQVRH